jgi:CHAT domain-containing protein
MEAYVLTARGKFLEAEPYYRRILQNLTPAIRKQVPGAYINFRSNLSINLKNQNRLIEAEAEARETLKEAIADMGRDSEITGLLISHLGEIFLRQGRLRDAEKLMRAGLRTVERADVSPDSYMMASARMRLGEVLAAREKFNAAMQQFDLARSGMQQNQYLYEKFFARNPALMLSLVRTGRIEEAEKQISSTYKQNSKLLGAKHYLTAEALGFRGMVYALQENDQKALKDFSEALPILLAPGSSAKVSYGSQLRRKIIAESNLGLLAKVHGTDLEKAAGIDASLEAFKLADALSGSAVRGAIGASTVRAAVSSPELADLVRQEQDAQKQLKLLETALTDNLTAPQDQQLPEVIQALKMKIDTLYTADDESYVWAIPHEGQATFSAVPLGRGRLSQMVADLRKSLDPKPQTLGDIPEFDTHNAYDLYRQLLMPVERGWKDATDVLIVAHGPLGQLPFAVLPTAPVLPGADPKVLFSRYKKVPWLIRRASITRLPSASTFVNLRTVAEGDPGRKPFAGFGDPFFNKQQQAEAQKEKAAVATAGREGYLHVRGVRLSKEGILDSDNIVSCTINNLNRLPDTSAENKHIANALGADPVSDVFLGERATEQQVKSMDLSDRRVIAFATHALVPGDLDGLDQPALALSSPSISGDNEDGLLTMGEILRLKLNADWVVLSACNTGAAEGKGAEAISGLGRAFFYAGTRAILVSMWPVETTSASKLTTGLFRYQQRDPSLSRARALQKSALALMDGPGLKDHASGKIVASYAHPLFWAPFIIVGESASHTH